MYCFWRLNLKTGCRTMCPTAYFLCRVHSCALKNHNSWPTRCDSPYCWWVLGARVSDDNPYGSSNCRSLWVEVSWPFHLCCRCINCLALPDKLKGWPSGEKVTGTLVPWRAICLNMHTDAKRTSVCNILGENVGIRVVFFYNLIKIFY